MKIFNRLWRPANKAKLYAAWVRLGPLIIGWAVGRGYLDTEDGNLILEVVMVIAALTLTVPGSTAFRHNREKMVRSNLVDGE